MTSPRAPMDPPDLAGYDHIGLLGSGGFSDVFLYERRFPRQKVAIKVLVPGALGDAGEARFTDEANLMAGLSTHPYIVTVYEAAISPGGLPYLVMEYYPRPNFLVRARSERFSVAAVLRVGVQVAAAVETAHRNGVVHRDIKPPNVLTSEYGRPGLTDFGLAVGGGRAGEAEGLSIPWSPPEVVAGVGDADVRSDVYSLAATLWTLLSGGRSPFEKAGANKGIDLIDRIERAPVPPVDRGDVPASLQRLLAQAMAKDPGHRPATAAELARALQVIEVEQRFDMTPFEVSDDQPTTAGGGAIELDAAPTRVKDLTVIESQRAPTAPAEPGGDGPPAPGAMIEAPAALRPVAAAPGPAAAEVISSTPYRREAADGDGGDPAAPPAPVRSARTGAPVASTYRAPSPAPAPGSPPGRRTALLVAAGVAALLLLAAVVVAVVVATGGDDDEPDPTTTSTSVPGSEGAPLEPPSNVRVERLGEGEFRAVWDAPSGMESGDRFELTIDGEPAEAPFNRTTFEFSSERSSPCVVITAVRDGVPSAPASNRGGC